MTSYRSVLLLVIVGVIALLLGFVSLRLLRNRQTEALEPPASPSATESLAQSFDSMVLMIPIIEYKDGNVLTEPTVTGYQEKVVETGSTFTLDPATLDVTLGSNVGAMELRLIDAAAASITVDVLADVRLDGNFHPRDSVERYDISDGSCIPAFSLVMDVNYEYCFELIERNSQVELRYEVSSESTMPGP